MFTLRIIEDDGVAQNSLIGNNYSLVSESSSQFETHLSNLFPEKEEQQKWHGTISAFLITDTGTRPIYSFQWAYIMLNGTTVESVGRRD